MTGDQEEPGTEKGGLTWKVKKERKQIPVDWGTSSNVQDFFLFFVFLNGRTFFFFFFFFFKFYFIFKLYNIVLVLPNIEMNPPRYMILKAGQFVNENE